ncbi:MAG: aminotransferase class III-fold pyridoxal phosphate-dependent enzyme, partial [Bacilli bacterium]
CLGKVVGGGLPVGAYGGSKALMQQIAPAGPVYQAGTLSGNPLAMQAGIETLNLLNPEVYAHFDAISSQLKNGFLALSKTYNIPLVVQAVGGMFGLFFTTKNVENYEDAKAAQSETYAQFFNGMLNEGVYLPPSAFEAWFLSSVHTEKHIEQTLQAAEKVFATLK